MLQKVNVEGRSSAAFLDESTVMIVCGPERSQLWHLQVYRVTAVGPLEPDCIVLELPRLREGEFRIESLLLRLDQNYNAKNLRPDQQGTSWLTHGCRDKLLIIYVSLADERSPRPSRTTYHLFLLSSFILGLFTQNLNGHTEVPSFNPLSSGFSIDVSLDGHSVKSIIQWSEWGPRNTRLIHDTAFSLPPCCVSGCRFVTAVPLNPDFMLVLDFNPSMRALCPNDPRLQQIDWQQVVSSQLPAIHYYITNSSPPNPNFNTFQDSLEDSLPYRATFVRKPPGMNEQGTLMIDPYRVLDVNVCFA
jgi:hypothetical protein